MLNNIIFLSHSSKTPAALADVDQLRTALEKAGFVVRLDFRTIQGGEDWNAEIDHWMSECGAAVILLSPDALLSDWVFTEARILQWRKGFAPQLTLIPVVISGVTKDKFLDSERHELLKLDTLQILEETNAASSAPHILQALGPPVPAIPSELQQVTDKIAGLLSRMTELEFTHIFSRLGVTLPPWRPSSQHSTTMARTLARRFLDMKIYRADEIVDVLGEAVSAEAKKTICHQLAAFWVRSEAARLLREASLKQPGCWAVALNGRWLLDFTAEAYVRRAFWPKGLWHLIRVEGGAGTDAARHVEESILEGVRRLNAPAPKRDPKDWLRQAKNAVLVLLPDWSMVDRQALEQLRTQYPRLIFILGTGETLLDLAAEGYTELTHLQPELDLNEEQEAQRAFNDAIALLSGS
jgi:hypothetical protein